MSAASMTRLKKYWGDEAPEWLIVLATECDRTSQSKVGKVIGYSTTTINRALGKRYTDDPASVEKAVRGAFMNVTVQCPVLDEIPANRCVENQRKPYASTNPLRVRLYQACRQCPNNTTEGN